MGGSRKIRGILTTLFSALVIFASVSISYAGYITTQITSNSYYDHNPQINDNGYVVWRGYEGSYCDIFLYDGTSVTNISSGLFPADYNNEPQINNNGYVVWHSGSSIGNIYLYDGTSATRIGYGLQPRMNNNGFVVWVGYGGLDSEIYLYDGTNTRQLTEDAYDDIDPQINDNGYVVWSGYDGSDYEIYLFDGANVVQLTDNSYFDGAPQINDNGYVVWSGYDGSDYEIYLYDGTNTTNITNNGYDDRNPQINNNGFVVWVGNEGLDEDRYNEIYLYDGTNTIQLTDNLYFDGFPQINDSGYVVWQGHDGHDTEIYLYDGTITRQLSYKPYTDNLPQINNNSYVVWSGGSVGGSQSDYEIFMAASTNEDLTLLSPNGGELVPPGLIYVIRWNATLGAVKFKIEYSTDNGETWAIIANEVTGTNYDWLVPNINTGKCFVKVTGFDSSGVRVCEDFSNSNFTIGILKVTYPDGREVLTSGSTHTITWQTSYTSKPVAMVKLKYTKNVGDTWHLITKLIGNPGRYVWTVPSVTAPKAKCKVKVILVAADGTVLATDKSDSFFAIQP